METPIGFPNACPELPMRVEYINPFLSSIVNTFQTMLSCELTRGDLALKGHPNPVHEISGIIGLSGQAVGTVVLSLSRPVALEAASVLLMAPYDELNDDVIDAVGELTNVVAGAAKAELESLHLSVSLPNVIVGTEYHIRFPSDVHPIVIPYESAWGPLALEVGLALTPAAVEA